MGSISHELRPKLERLIPLLSSDKPGEVVATAAAITRTLRSAGVDWIDLARDIGTGPTSTARLENRFHPRTRPTGPTVWHAQDRYAVCDVLKMGIADRVFSDREIEFSRSSCALIDQSRGKLTDKQAANVNRLLAKVMGGRP